MAPPRHEQLDLFPAPVSVHQLDATRIAGVHSHVRAVYAVRLGHDRRLHRVFVDRYGIYCEDHGRGCDAARRVAG